MDLAGRRIGPEDRFETLRPGYAVVAAQLATPRKELGVRGVSLSPDHRTLILSAALPCATVFYKVTLPGLGRATCLPHLDMAATRGLTFASPEHQRFWPYAATAGEFSLRTQLRLKDLLRPAVQPGPIVDTLIRA